MAEGRTPNSEPAAEPTWLDFFAELAKALTPETPAAPTTAKAPQEPRVFAHYVAYNMDHLLALVIGRDEKGRADLAVFTNMKNAAGKKNFGLQFHQDVVYGEMKLPGTWHWLD